MNTEILKPVTLQDVSSHSQVLLRSTNHFDFFGMTGFLKATFIAALCFLNPNAYANISLTPGSGLVTLKGTSVAYTVADDNTPTAANIGAWDVNGNTSASPATGLQWNVDLLFFP